MLKVAANHKIKPETGEISEIFSSIQGEGIFVGQKHLFVRFRACNIACDYCDEHDKLVYQNLSASQIVGELVSLERQAGPHDFVSLTGGEPLVYVEFLKKLIPLLHEKNMRVYLETNGILPRALIEVISGCDVVAMDIKLPSVTRERPFFREHEEFLRIAKQKQVFVKMVISKELEISEFLAGVGVIACIDKNIPLVLQPKTNVEDGLLDSGAMEFLSSLTTLARNQLSSVRAVPQMHKLLGIR
ncbi:MAG: 7-carboxy-7-deazaguanine synthase QueE [Candidatus Omnitrophica bacterium]|nr:7-carboxy-7-deazaguanine synthase QueE [Candidatus Omnitrophota bacterium]